MKQLKRSKRRVVLKVKGKAAAFMQDATGYQHLLDIAARVDSHEGIRQGLEEVRQGKGCEIEAFYTDFEAKHGIPG